MPFAYAIFAWCTIPCDLFVIVVRYLGVSISVRARVCAVRALASTPVAIGAQAIRVIA